MTQAAKTRSAPPGLPDSRAVSEIAIRGHIANDRVEERRKQNRRRPGAAPCPYNAALSPIQRLKDRREAFDAFHGAGRGPDLNVRNAFIREGA